MRDFLLQLQDILNVGLGPVITNPPSEAIGGTVFVMEHGWFWSVNHQSGDTGWQSERIYARDQANIAAEILAEHLEARVST